MKLLLINLLLWSIAVNVMAQQFGEKRISIELNERVAFHSVDETYTLIDNIIYHSPTNFRVYPDYDTIIYKGELYIILQYPPYKPQNTITPKYKHFLHMKKQQNSVI